MTSQYEQVDLVVPTGHVNCCPCPDHSTNYVGVAYKSYRLRLVDANSNEMPVYVTSPAPGRVRLKFRYWNVVGGRFVQDEAVQTVTSVKPPLLVEFAVSRCAS